MPTLILRPAYPTRIQPPTGPMAGYVSMCLSARDTAAYEAWRPDDTEALVHLRNAYARRRALAALFSDILTRVGIMCPNIVSSFIVRQIMGLNPYAINYAIMDGLLPTMLFCRTGTTPESFSPVYQVFRQQSELGASFFNSDLWVRTMMVITLAYEVAVTSQPLRSVSDLLHVWGPIQFNYGDFRMAWNRMARIIHATHPDEALFPVSAYTWPQRSIADLNLMTPDLAVTPDPCGRAAAAAVIPHCIRVLPGEEE